MKTLTANALSVFLLLAGTAHAGDRPPAAGGTLDGTWVIASLEIDNKPVAIDDNLTDIRRVVSGDTHTITLKNNRMVLIHKIDATKSPKTLDMLIVEGDEKGKTYHAIYKVERDTLTICRHVDPDRPRPTGFFTEPDSGGFLIVWKRIRP
jgi:uncharacterized protein (TIGR03067 family)